MALFLRVETGERERREEREEGGEVGRGEERRGETVPLAPVSTVARLTTL